MRKRLIAAARHGATTHDDTWLDLEALAEVEITSEDPDNPISMRCFPVGQRAGSPPNLGSKLFASSSLIRNASSGSCFAL